MTASDRTRSWDAYRAMQTAAERGKSSRVDDFLTPEESDTLDPETLLDFIYAEFLARSDAGEAVRTEEYITRFPRVAEGISRQFAVHHLLESSDQTAVYSETISRPAVPETIGRYRIIAPLGSGGQATTYRAFHPDLGREVALKWAHAAIRGTQADALRQEGRLLATLDHPGIARVYDLDVHEGRPFVALEYVHGVTLEQLRREGPMLAPNVVRYICESAQAIASAHRAGILHRDLKPANILLGHDGRIRVIDFGLAEALSDGASTTLPYTGTLRYMAPEQAADVPILDVRTDVFGLGGTLYALIVGAPPFAPGSVSELLQRVRAGEWDRASLTTASAPLALKTVCARALERRPEDRYPTAEAFAEACKLAVSVRRRRWLLVGGAVTGLAALAVLAGQSLPKPEAASPTVTPPSIAPAVSVPLALSVRVWSEETGRYRTLAQEAPLGKDRRIRLTLEVPAGRAVRVFALDASGKAEQLETVPVAAERRRLELPSDPEAAFPLKAPAGTTVILAWSGSADPIALFGSQAWDALPADAIIVADGTGVSIVGERGIGPIVPQANPVGRTVRRLETARTAWVASGAEAMAIAFTHE